MKLHATSRRKPVTVWFTVGVQFSLVLLPYTTLQTVQAAVVDYKYNTGTDIHSYQVKFF